MYFYVSPSGAVASVSPVNSGSTTENLFVPDT